MMQGLLALQERVGGGPPLLTGLGFLKSCILFLLGFLMKVIFFCMCVGEKSSFVFFLLLPYFFFL